MADFPLKAVPPSLIGVPVPPLVLREDTAGDIAGANTAVTLLQTDSAGSLRHTAEGGKATYIANSQFACDSTATDIWTFAGNATNTVKILWMLISSVATTAITGRLKLLLRSTANTAGTAVAAGLVAYDQRSGTAGAPVSAPVHYTAHPTALGTQIGTGNLWSKQYLQNVVGSTVLPSDCFIDFRSGYGGQALRLAGTAQILCLNAAAALGAAGNLWDITVAFVEEPTTA